MYDDLKWLMYYNHLYMCEESKSLYIVYGDATCTEWRRPIGCLKFQVSVGKRATYYRALLREIISKDMASYASLSPCSKLTVAIFPERDSSAASRWLKPYCFVLGNEAAIWAARQHWACCSFLATVQLVRSPSQNTKISEGTPGTCTRCSVRHFVFREGDLTNWTVARKLQQAPCWHAA